ncbi:Pao retrotransposon peptidase family protein, partial [Aphelenchoides avenae]
MLHKEPLLLNPITAVLLNSRLAPYVLSADIAKAFLQVLLREEDRHVCRFLWVRDLTKPATGDTLVIYCFNRVIFGLRPSPALLGVTVEHHMQTLDTKLSREILANCYVDNIYLTADDLPEASAKYQDSKEIFASMNMNLREFATNDTSFNASLPKEDQAMSDGFKQLGIHWDLDADEWVFDFKVGSLTENWSQCTRETAKTGTVTNLELQLVGILLKEFLGQYPLVGLGECGLDYTKKAVVRNADGRVQTRNGEPALSHAIGAKRNHQWPVFEAQLKLAKQLRRPDGGHYPLILHLRDKESMNTD